MPNYVTITTEIQFMAYLRLIRERLKLLNHLLVDFRPVKRNQWANEMSIPFSRMTYSQQEIVSKQFSGSNDTRRQVLSTLQRTHSSVGGTSNDAKRARQTWWCRLTAFMRKPRICKINFRLNANRILSDLENISKLQQIYTKLERASLRINASYSMQLVIILILKFTTLTTLLYFCCMMIMKWVWNHIQPVDVRWWW